MILEVIASNIRDVKAASEYGADRIELCVGMKEDGITPSYGLIESAVEISKIPINVIIRSHPQSFFYESSEVDTMVRDIRMVRKLGANGIVIGALTEDGRVDVEVMQRLLEEAEGLDVTFHRAIDFSRNLEETLEALIQFKQVKRILTAGGRNPATESIPMIKKLKELAENTHLTIMPGYGLRAETFKEFYDEVRPKEIHFGSGVREENSFMKSIERTKIDRIKQVLV
ncbi:copper homeostasis protein CutC [Lederbergia wuyishanensis]|uniref:PF03932 family protein CutC n=1 Tax=Lederbergia wuyishanensis TaxID=1347903 RepID=A0ABU0D9J6_9BACI|nr:copper homeostasis protein CutC [Lederbergia wuyishanensis]MCJ8007472.1 copper homeostasis protein CutC [Lederbergia wuyishanensis]MDQ0345089.1 copper homeostasis protein [Lederbergia wuyishanensis]